MKELYFTMRNPFSNARILSPLLHVVKPFHNALDNLSPQCYHWRYRNAIS